MSGQLYTISAGIVRNNAPPPKGAVVGGRVHRDNITHMVRG